jgi:hypothetical protein
MMSISRAILASIEGSTLPARNLHSVRVEIRSSVLLWRSSFSIRQACCHGMNDSASHFSGDLAAYSATWRYGTLRTAGELNRRSYVSELRIKKEQVVQHRVALNSFWFHHYVTKMIGSDRHCAVVSSAVGQNRVTRHSLLLIELIP